MEPLLCPQCGGAIVEYQAGDVFAVCQYCSTRFRIEGSKQPVRKPEPVDPPQLATSIDLPPFVCVLGIALALDQ